MNGDITLGILLLSTSILPVIIVFYDWFVEWIEEEEDDDDEIWW